MSQHDKDKKHQDDYTKVANILDKANYSRSTGEAVNDLWQSTKSGLVAVPQALVGISNLMSGGHTGKAVQENIWDMKKTQENIQAQKSDTAKAQQAQFERAEGFGGKLGAIWDNPMMAVDATVQSLPQMFAGGLVGRGIGKMAGIQNGAVRAGIGEGTIMAGTAAENMRAENTDGLLTGKEMLASVGTGVAGGLLGYGGGRLAERWGLVDGDVLATGGVRTTSQTGAETAQNTAKGLSGWKGSVAGIGKGALAEGVLEELPQTIAETALDNWANDRALTENMAGNAAMGLASGGLMGGTMGGISGWRGKGNNQNPPPNSIIPEDYTPTAPNSGGSTAVDVDEHGNIIPKPANAPSGETALAPVQERWADQSRMIDDSTERQGFQGGLLENKGTPILDRNIALENGTILRAGDPNAYNQWLAYEREQAIAKRDENIRQGFNDITPVPTEAVAYGLASNLNNHQGVDTPLLEFSQSVVDRMVENGVDVHALTDSQDKQAQLTDILRNTDPRTFTSPQNFDNWVAQNEYINQFKVDNQNRGLAQPQKPSEQLGLDPNAGALSRSAVVAVDSGASPVGQVLQQSTAGQVQPTPQIDGLSAYQAQRAEQQQAQAKNEQIAKEVFANAPKLTGKQNYIQNGNERLPTQIMVVEADSLLPSTDNAINQARDRSRASSQDQIRAIVDNLDPAQLADSTTMGHGSPTISSDGTIIAGNGRTMALKQAYTQGKADEYRQMLLDKADEYGLDKSYLATMKNPVLVKNVGNVAPDKLRQLALNSNETGTMAQSAFENAKADVERVASLNLGGLQINENTGDINTPANRAIINDFINQFPIEQQNALRTADGMLSKQGLERFENALLLSAYGDNPTTQSILESTDTELRNAIKAMVATAPSIAKTKQNIKEGITPDDDIASDISEALSVLAQLRREGVKPSDYLAQQNLFGDVLSETGKRLLDFMDKNIKSVVKIRSLLYKYYANLSQENLKQDDMFGKPIQTKQSRLNDTFKELGHDEFIQSSTNRNEPNTQSDSRASASQSATETRPIGETGAVNERPKESQRNEQGTGRDDGGLNPSIPPQTNKQTQDDSDVVSKLGLDRALFEKLKAHHQTGGHWNEFNLFSDLKDSADKAKITAEYEKIHGKTPNKIQLAKFLKGQVLAEINNSQESLQSALTQAEPTRPKTNEQKKDKFANMFANAINEKAIANIKNLSDNEQKELNNIFAKLDAHQNGKPIQQEQDNHNDPIFEQVKHHKDITRLLGDKQALGNDLIAKDFIKKAISDVLVSNLNRADGVAMMQEFSAHMDRYVNDYHQKLKEQQNAITNPTQSPSDRILADTPSDSVGTNGNGRTPSSVHSKSDKSSAGRNTNQSTNGNDSERSPVVQPDGAKTGLSSGVESNYQTAVNEIRRLANSLPKFDFLASLSELGTKLFGKPNLANNQAHFDYVEAQSDEFGIKFPTDKSEYEKAVFAYWDRVQKSSVKDSDDEVNTPASPEKSQESTTSQALDNALSATNQADFALSDEMVQTGSVKDKLATNIAIIELLQTLKQENRQPTNDEKALMAKYTGFGGLSNAFPDSQGNYKKGFETLGARLRNLMSRDEYENARASSTSAFFTPPNVINAMWDIAQRLGYNGGVVLEPSAGVGAFIGHAPKNLPQKIIGTEIDPTTHAITGYLYPHANIFNQGYETLSVPDNSVDLAIGNPPYGGVRLNFKDKPHLSGKTIANSFMQGTLEQVKPNGLSVMVVSSSFMDSTDASTRKAMAELGELVGAVRLPNTTFDDAGTAVVADILVFKKHDESTLQAYKDGTKTDYPSWVQSGKRQNDDGTEVNFNPYFDDKVAGEFEFGTGEGGRAVYTVKETGSLDKALDKFVKSFAKVKPTRSTKEIEADINKHAQAMVDSLTLEASGESVGFIGRENSVLVQVIEQDNGKQTQLKKRPLTPASVWSDSFMQDLDGRWYKLEDKKDANGKPIKAKDKDGKSLRVNEKVKVYYDEKDIHAQSKLGVKGMNVLNQALEIQGLIENQIRLEQGGASDTDIENNRKELNGAYDKFVKTFGYMNNPSNIKYISKLPKANFILALETGYKKEVAIGTGKNKEVTEPETAGKADILSKRVLVPKTQKTHADSPKDALSLSLAYTGGVDLGLMSELTGQSKDALTDTLTATGELFFDPASDSYVVKDEYLSGNIRQKIANAREHGLTNNIAELEKVLPQDVPIENISIRLGMNWLPTEIYSEFAQKLLGNPNASIDYESLTHNFSVSGTASHTAMNEFGAGGKSPEWILSHILNSKQIRVTQTVDKKTVLLPTETQEANDMAKTIKAEFENFIYSHPEIDKIAKLYNEKHNAIVPRKYDGSHLELIGKVPDDVIKLRTHQMNAVWRGVTTNAVLYDHAVGSGKTFTGIARGMERKRLDLSKKPVLVVPNHMVEQFAQDIYRLYPSANILTAGQKDFAKAKRKRLFGQIATGDYDIIVLPHSSFEFIKLSKERQKAMLEQERDKLMDAIRATKAEQGKRENLKQLEQAKKNIETKLAKLAETKRHDDEFTFEQMGIDDITVDEAHEFKNLFFHTKMQGVKGLGSPAGSNKAMDLWLKTQYLHQTNGAIAFMTGTPISNSAAEMHAVMRYLMPNTLEEMGLDNFDAWANTYAENVAKFEATESGQLKLATRFAREWQNMGSLMSLWKSVTDSVTNDDIKKTYKEETGKEFPLPQVDGGTRQSVVVKPTHQQEQILQMILAGFAKIEAKTMSKDEAGKLRLQLMDLATKNALDPRTINPSLDAGGKIGAVVDNVFDVYQKWHDDKGTQIIFLDRSTPKGKGDDKKIMEYEALLQRRENAIQAENDEELLKVNDLLDKYDENEMAELVSAKNGGFSAYDEIKKGLIAKGIPADEIAFIQEAETDDEKRELFDKVNAGRVRVIIGSSQRMGAGTNIQKRLVALHHMDAPWKPSDIEQREGRIIRQGNELYAKYGHDNFKVQINAYVTEKTADAKRWDTMSAKLGTINAIRHYNGEHTLDFQEDEENSSFQEIAALATGNPLMRERVELTAQKEQLERQRLSHQKRDAGNRTKLAEAERQAQSLPVKIKSLETAQAEYETLLPQAQVEFDKTFITIDGQKFSDRKSAGEYLDNKAKQAEQDGKKASYVINGESVGSLSAATKKVRESAIGKKGTTPTLITVGKQTYTNANEAINDTVISQVNQHNNDTAIVKIMGFDVRSYNMGKYTLLAVETTDGYELTHTTLDHHATREKVENAFARLANTLEDNMGNALSYAQNQLKIANDTVSQLEGKTGQAFAGEQELKEISERLNEVQALLSDDDSDNAFADDEKFDDLLELLDSRAIGGKTGKAFVPKANYDISTFDESDDVDETDFADIATIPHDELTSSQKQAIEAVQKLPNKDPNKVKFAKEVYALDRSDTPAAKKERNAVVQKITAYELVWRKTSELQSELNALGYNIKTGKINIASDEINTQFTATQGETALEITFNRTLVQARANDPTRSGFFVKNGDESYQFGINELNIAGRIGGMGDYRTNGEYFGKNRPQLTYTDGTEWQELMRQETARLYDDDPALAGFVEQANNRDLDGVVKNEIRLTLTAYVDKLAVRGNALYPHDVGIDGMIDHEQRGKRKLKQDRPYFGDNRPRFEPKDNKDWSQKMAGQLARLFDDDPRLAELTEQANNAKAHLKMATVLKDTKEYANKLSTDGNAMFHYEVIARQNANYHKGDYKFSKQGSRYGTTADEVLDTLNHRFGKDTIAKLQANNSLNVLSLAQAREQFGNIPDNADGFYVNGTAYLVHDNIHPDMIIPTFLHELGGHGGLQTLMSDTAYQGFMREFDRLVASGDKLAVKAKTLADKHSKNKAEAQNEYLPYLITLASRQKENQGKIKSLINRMIMAIRTFVRQKLGVSLPVTPDEIVAVAEKAVRERASGAFDPNNDDIRFSLNESDDSDFARAVDEVLNGKTPNGYIKLGTTPDVLKLLGIGNGKVRIKGFALKQAMINHLRVQRSKTKGNHGISPEILKELPKQLNNPIAISRSSKNSSNPDGYVVLTELTENKRGNDKPVIAALRFGKNKNGLDLIDIASVHGRDDKQIIDALNEDLLYLHKEKARHFLTTHPLQLHWDITSDTELSSRNIKTNDDLSQYQNDTGDEFVQNLDIKFSKMSDLYDAAKDETKETVEKLGKVATDFIANPKSFVRQGASNAKADHLGKFLQFLGRRQLTDLYGKKLQGLKEYNDRVAQMDADSNETAFRADQLVNKWAKVKDSQALAELMHDVTLTGIDPSQPKKAGVGVKYQQLKVRYDALSNEAREVYQQARDDYQNHYKAMHRAMVERIQRNDKLTDKRKAKLIAELDKELQATQKAFFPLTRFGDYVVVVRDTDGNVVNVARAETKGQADEVRRQLIKDNPNHKVDNVVLGRELDIRNLAGIKGLASEFLADDLGLDDKLHQDYLNALLDRQFATNNVMIKNTAGFSQNARRAYAHHMSRGSHHIAKLRHTDRLKADLERMQAYIDSQDDDVIELQRVMDELNKRHALLLNPPMHPVSSLATAVGFMWYMGLSPASALVNMTQTLLVAMPMMSVKYGFAKSNKMLGEISALLAKNKNDLTNVLTGDEKKAFDEAVRRGVIDMTQAHDLAGVANGENSAVMEKIKPVMKVASFMFHQAEKFNRQVTFVASYRLAVEKGLTSEQAMEEAIKLTYDGHFDYASSNRPRFMQGNWQRVLFLFKQYGQNMVYTLARQTYLSFKGETPQAKAEARKIMAGILAGHAMSAGVLGLPLVTTLLAVASALGGDDDEPWDAEVALRNQLAELLGDDVAEVLTKGLPRAFGADLSSRVGLDSLILPRLQDGLEGQRLGENLIVGLAGPVMNIPVSITKGMSQIGQGQTLQGIENMIPKALRDPLKAYRYATDGNVDKSGIEIVEKENVGVSDIAQQAIGFRSGKFAQAQEVKSAIYQADKELTGIRKGLVDSYARAYRDGDMERADEIWERIKRFNEKNPSVRITKPALMQSIRERNRRIENAKDGIYLNKNREHLREYGAFGVE